MNIVHLNDLNPLSRLRVAEQVSGYSATPGNGVAPVSIEDILETEHAFVAWQRTDLAGFVRAKNEVHHVEEGVSYQQIGSLMVTESFRGQKVAVDLVENMTDLVVVGGITPYAFVNAQSRTAFTRNEYRAAGPDEIPFATSQFGNQAMVYADQNFEQHHAALLQQNR